MSEVATTRVYLVDYKTGEVCYPARYQKYDGDFIVSPKGCGNKQEHQVRAKTEDELIERIRQGCKVRVKIKGRPNLRRYNFFVDGKQVTFKDKKAA